MTTTSGFASDWPPLAVNASTGELYLPLPSPYDNIIITPPRPSDAPAIVRNLNDVTVYRWLQGPPHPYLSQHAEEWLDKVKGESESVLEELGSGSEIVGGCPVRVLREVQADGTDIMLGDIGVDRCGFPGVQDPQERSRLDRENMERPIGDVGVVFCIGDYLASSHHGRGIMSAAVGTIVREWMIPRMGARLIRAEVFKGNGGSVRVFEKNGFVLEETVDVERVISSGEKTTGMHILWWRRPVPGK